MIIATFPGTGLDIVSEIVHSAGHTLVMPKDRHAAYNVNFDRLILLGGRDISPFLYGEPIYASNSPDERRDTTEWVLARRAISLDIPTLGICRGHQMLAVAHGGALHQDIMVCLGLEHPNVQHTIKKVDKRLAPYLPSRKVNSLHHQALTRAPLGFSVAAYSPDGLIESIYRPGFLGVQWHPELLYRRDKDWKILFDWWLAGLD